MVRHQHPLVGSPPALPGANPPPGPRHAPMNAEPRSAEPASGPCPVPSPEAVPMPAPIADLTGPLSAPSTQPGAPNLLVFDSGLGGLSVLAEIRRALPAASVTYVADDAAFPYGAWAEPDLVARVVALMGDLIAAHRPDLVVIACNTASTLVLPALRANFSLPFVGTVPAIKPASAATRSGMISVLATPGTVKRDYTRALIDTYASHRDVTLVGSVRLASLAEAHLRGMPIDDAEIRAEIAPCFREVDGQRTDTIVLGCTHYPFLLDQFRRLAPWDVTWIDPAPAIARRVHDVLGPNASLAGDAPIPTPGRAIFTSGAPVPASLVAPLAALGLVA